MKPFTVSVTVDRPRAEVHAFLSDLANHQQYTDHFLVDWTVESPEAARFRADTRGPEDWMEARIVETAPDRIVEETVGGQGKRKTRGTYTLHELGEQSTRVQFTLEPVQTPLRERLAGFTITPWLRGRNQIALNRLGELLSRKPA